MADKIVVLNAGRVEQVGSPLELYDHPANLFVAGFIGSPKMNFVAGKAAGELGAATIGVRPEHISARATGGRLARAPSRSPSMSAATPSSMSTAGELGDAHGAGRRRARRQAGRPRLLTPDPARIHRFDEGRRSAIGARR